MTYLISLRADRRALQTAMMDALAAMRAASLSRQVDLCRLKDGERRARALDSGAAELILSPLRRAFLDAGVEAGRRETAWERARAAYLAASAEAARRRGR